MSENVTLDRIEFEKIKQQAKAARVEYLRRYRAAPLVVAGSTFAIALTLTLLLYGPRTHSDQLAAAAKVQKVVTHGAPVSRH